MAQILIPFSSIVDDTGALVAGATVVVASVKNPLTDANIAGAVTSVVLSADGLRVGVLYDPEAFGQAWITLLVTKVGNTFSGTNAAPVAFASLDPQTLANRSSQASLDTLAGYVDTEVAAIKLQTDLLPADPASNTQVATRSSQASLDTAKVVIDATKVVVDAITLKTALLPGDPASNTQVATRSSQASLDTLAGYVDTEVAAIKLQTDLLPSDPASAATIAASFVTTDAAIAANAGLTVSQNQLLTRMAAVVGISLGAGPTAGWTETLTGNIMVRNYPIPGGGTVIHTINIGTSSQSFTVSYL